MVYKRTPWRSWVTSWVKIFKRQLTKYQIFYIRKKINGSNIWKTLKADNNIPNGTEHGEFSNLTGGVPIVTPILKYFRISKAEHTHFMTQDSTPSKISYESSYTCVPEDIYRMYSYSLGSKLEINSETIKCIQYTHIIQN